jgi:hypothetical protein
MMRCGVLMAAAMQLHLPLHRASVACLCAARKLFKVLKNKGLEMFLQAIRWSLLLLCLALLGGCASTKTLDEVERTLLVERASERWKALEVRDWDTAYSFLSPAYRAVFSGEMYSRRFSYMVEWELTSVEFIHYDAPAAVASVAVRVMSRSVKQTSAASVAIGAVPTRVVEQWILSDGEWWYSANL